MQSNATARRRTGTVAALAATFAASVSVSTFAQAPAYPTKPLRVVVPFAPGGNTDIVGRLLAPRMQEILGQNVVIDNRPGAGGNIGSDIVAKGSPDGYTLLYSTLSTYALNVALYAKLPFDPAKDLAPIALTVEVPIMVGVPAGLGVRDLGSFVKLLRDKPAAYSYGSAGSGTSGHIACHLFTQKIGATAVVHVPYKGSGPVLLDLLAGRLTFAMDAWSVFGPHIRAGRLVPLAVSVSRRLSVLPDVPTMAEAGVPGYEAYSWNAYWAPAGTPRPVLDRLHATIQRAMQEPVIRQRLEADGVPPYPPLSRDETVRFMRAELDKWVPIVRATGARVD